MRQTVAPDLARKLARFDAWPEGALYLETPSGRVPDLWHGPTSGALVELLRKTFGSLEIFLTEGSATVRVWGHGCGAIFYGGTLGEAAAKALVELPAPLARVS